MSRDLKWRSAFSVNNEPTQHPSTVIPLADVMNYVYPLNLHVLKKLQAYHRAESRKCLKNPQAAFSGQAWDEIIENKVV